MNYRVSKPDRNLVGRVLLNASKSESNRALVIQKVTEGVVIDNLSQAADTVVLQQLLEEMPNVLDVGAAGTTMRFLTAVLSITEGEHIITGSDRMKERPIEILVDALRELGARIEYEEKEGFPPLKIQGTSLKGGVLTMRGDVSSQYISAILLIAPILPGGVILQFSTELVSLPYLEMTIGIMRKFGAEVAVSKHEIEVKPVPYRKGSITIESDWSAASYWYEMAAFSDAVDIELVGLRKESLQGDATLASVYEQFGVNSEFTDAGVRLTKVSNFQPFTSNFELNYEAIPDIAQTLACTCAGLGIGAKLSGLRTLRIKGNR